MIARVCILLVGAACVPALLAGCDHDPLTLAPLPNDPPRLESVAAFPDSADAGSLVSLLADASDPDGDSLRVQWSVEAGVLTVDESGTLWEPPDGEGTYRAKVLATDPRGAQTESEVRVRILPRAGANKRPDILALTADDLEIPPNRSTNVRVSAEDPDGDPIRVDWAATGGRVLPQGDVLTWLAPAEQGAYTVSVAVTDDEGAASARNVVIRVHLDNLPPEILSVEVSEPTVRLGRGVTLTADATDADDDDALLTYDWRAAGGEFEGHGSAVLWIAPEGPACCAIGLYEIQVFVTDARGAASGGAVFIEVIQ